MTGKNERHQKFSNPPKKADVRNLYFEETLKNTKKEKMNPLSSEVEALQVMVGK